MNAYLNHYQNNQVATASPEQILIMLYDGAIRFLNQARSAMAERKYAVKGEKIGRVIAIVSELSATLDHEVGGEISANLEALYGFIIRELSRANVQNDPEPLKIALGILSELRETWVEAAEIALKEKASALQPFSVETDSEPRRFAGAY